MAMMGVDSSSLPLYLYSNWESNSCKCERQCLCLWTDRHAWWQEHLPLCGAVDRKCPI